MKQVKTGRGACHHSPEHRVIQEIIRNEYKSISEHSLKNGTTVGNGD